MTLISILAFVVVAAFASLAKMTRTDPVRAQRVVRTTSRTLGALSELFGTGHRVADRWAGAKAGSSHPMMARRAQGPEDEDE